MKWKLKVLKMTIDKIFTPELKKELDIMIVNLAGAVTLHDAKERADLILSRVKMLTLEQYSVPLMYGNIAYSYGEWWIKR